MEMQQVRYFLAVARTLNFTRAAEDCNVTQPSLTRAIQALEAELGGALIRREGRRSHLTDLGERMLPLLRQCYESAQAAKAVATSIRKGESATLSLAVAGTVDLSLLLMPLSEMARAFPGLQLRVRRGKADDISELLKAGKVDVAVGWLLGEAWERLESWPMFTESFDMVVGSNHTLAAQNDIELDVELVRGERLLVPAGIEVSEDDLAGLLTSGLDIQSAHEVDSLRDLEALVEANFGIAIVPASALQSAALRHMRLSRMDLRRTVALYTVAGRQRSRELTTFLNLMRGRDWNRPS
jgi:DNA-binding transcriptional LysR family regulator